MDKDIRINLPDDVKYIIEQLTAAGYEAYAVGGCVRVMKLQPIVSTEPTVTTDVRSSFHLQGNYRKIC